MPARRLPPRRGRGKRDTRGGSGTRTRRAIGRPGPPGAGEAHGARYPAPPTSSRSREGRGPLEGPVPDLPQTHGVALPAASRYPATETVSRHRGAASSSWHDSRDPAGAAGAVWGHPRAAPAGAIWSKKHVQHGVPASATVHGSEGGPASRPGGRHVHGSGRNEEPAPETGEPGYRRGRRGDPRAAGAGVPRSAISRGIQGNSVGRSAARWEEPGTGLARAAAAWISDRSLCVALGGCDVHPHQQCLVVVLQVAITFH